MGQVRLSTSEEAGTRQSIEGVQRKQAKAPIVSILMPVRNGMRFLLERFESIQCQSLTNWELIVVDGQSTDGSWETLCSLSETDSRIRVEQRPPNGIYDALNWCLSQASGKYIYIAMGDDTMTPDCLETMVYALERTPKAGIAHCNLVFINENGEPTDDKWEDMQKIQYYGPWISRRHIRVAPHDAVLYCVLGTMYTSLTQLLIRRSVFAQVGDFSTGFGSAGDFEWGLRAAWLVSTVHVPQVLASWRIHSEQATKDSFVFSAAGRRQRCAMVNAARRYLARIPNSGRLPRARLLSSNYRLEQLIFELQEAESRLRRGWILLGTLFTHPWVGTTYVLRRVTGKRRPGKDAVIRRLFTALNLNPAELLVAIPEKGEEAKCFEVARVWTDTSDGGGHDSPEELRDGLTTTVYTRV